MTNTPKEREEFEAAHVAKFGYMRGYYEWDTAHARYCDPTIGSHWQVWQLARSQPAATTEEPVAKVDAGDDGYYAEILPDRSVTVGQLLYAAAPQPKGLGSLKLYHFSTHGHNAPAYGCSEPNDNTGDYFRAHDVRTLLSRLPPVSAMQGDAALTVWYGAMPETTGASNFTAILYRKGGDMCDGITIDRSEYPDRVRYEADRVRHLIGELKEHPYILDYDAGKHSGYTAHPPAVQAGDVKPKSCCVWWETGEMWESSCGVAYTFESDGPVENEHKFCHKCGLELVVVVDEEDDPLVTDEENDALQSATPTEPAKPEGVKCTCRRLYEVDTDCPACCPPQPAPKERQAKCVCGKELSEHAEPPYHYCYPGKCDRFRACHQNQESNGQADH